MALVRTASFCAGDNLLHVCVKPPILLALVASRLCPEKPFLQLADV